MPVRWEGSLDPAPVLASNYALGVCFGFLSYSRLLPSPFFPPSSISPTIGTRTDRSSGLSFPKDFLRLLCLLLVDSVLSNPAAGILAVSELSVVFSSDACKPRASHVMFKCVFGRFLSQCPARDSLRGRECPRLIGPYRSTHPGPAVQLRPG